METLTVYILDKEYRVSCPVNEQEGLLSAARHLDAKMRGIKDSGNILGLERIAVMVALNLSHELLQANEKSHQYTDDNGRLAQLLDKIDKELTSINHSPVTE